MEAFLAHMSMAQSTDAVDNAFCQDRQLGYAWQLASPHTGHTSIEIRAIRWRAMAFGGSHIAFGYFIFGDSR
jgi:hypothetical protein